MYPTILLFGAGGQLGIELASVLSLLGRVQAADRARCDLINTTSIRTLIRETRPSLIVNAAAYTAVDKAESEPELAHQINAIAPTTIAEEALRLSAPLIHYSTDYVYDGKSTNPYSEDHPPAPASVYGASKLAGDQAIVASGCAHLIFRTSWVYGHFGKNFVKTILRLAIAREELSIVDDQIGAPTGARLLADATAMALVSAKVGGWDGRSGIYHLSAQGSTNWFEFACAIVRKAQQRDILPASIAKIFPTSTASYGSPAPRPHYSVMSNSKVHGAFGVQMPSWQESLEQYMHELACL